MSVNVCMCFFLSHLSLALALRIVTVLVLAAVKCVVARAKPLGGYFVYGTTFRLNFSNVPTDKAIVC